MSAEPPAPRRRLRLPGPETLFVLTAWLFAPLAISRTIVGASWTACAAAFAAWYGLLFLLLGGGSRGVRGAEGLGWTLILSLFFAWAGVPILAAVASVFL